MSGEQPQAASDHSTAPSLEKSSSDDIAEPKSEAPQEETPQEKLGEAPAAVAETNAAPTHFSPVPNGGLTAWLQVLGGFMLFFNTWGILNTFGVYQTYYEEQGVQTSSNISWIGSIQAFMVLLVGAFAGPIYDRGYIRWLLLFGSFMVVFGHMMLSITHSFWEIILAQAFVIGIGAGCLFVPAVAILPTYFSTKIGMAIGLAASGSSMGGIIYPIVFYRLIDQVGFGWSVRVVGFIALATLIIPIVVMKQRVKPAKARAVIDMTAFTDWPFVVFVLGAMVGFIGLYVVLFYVSYYGQAKGITDANLSFYLVPILNAGSVFGRTLPNILSDKTGPLNIIGPGAIIVGILIFCMIPVNSVGAIVVLALLLGFFTGIFIALPPVLFVALTKDKSKIGTRIGMGFGVLGLGVLAGGPGGGGILGTNNNDLNWTGAWAYGGATAMFSGFVFIGLRIYKAGWKLKVKI